MSRGSLVLAAAAILSACTGSGARSNGSLYRCEHGIEFTVKFVDDSAVLDGPRANEVLFRDAGGQGPLQSVYSNTNMRVEFGLGSGGREAVLHYALLPLVARCVRD